MAVDEDARTGARITPEQIEALRSRVGWDVGHTYRWHDRATLDAIRHFAHGVGDDNPLWCDPQYAAKTRWRSVVAPPLFYMCMGEDESPKMPPEVKASSKGALSGVHLFHAGTEIEWSRHVYPDDRLFYSGILAEVEAKESEFAGQSVIQHDELRWTNGRGEPVVFQHEWFVRTERRSAAARGKYDDTEEARYTDEDLARIDADYAAERPRGAEPLCWEDVRPGAAIPGVVKGPFTVTDLIAMHMGWGWGGYDFGPFRLGYKHRQKMRRFWTKDRRGAWDVVQRLHWEEEWASEVGVPLRYDYGFMRTAWMLHAVTDWMGDDAFVWRFWNRFDRFNFIGDTTWVQGEVTDVRTEDGHAVADLDLRCVSQRDEVTATGGATVILPSTKSGPVRLPDFSGVRRR